MRKILFSLVVSILLFLTAQASPPGCKASPGTTAKIIATAMKTIYNVFPIRIAGIKVLDFKGLEDVDPVKSPICVCWMGTPPIPRIGIPVSLWEPVRILETVKMPYCSPFTGMYLPIGINAQNLGGGATQNEGNQHISGAQVHYMIFPVWTVLELFLDFICLEHTGFDIAYLSELDPLWQDEILTAVIEPEAVVFANPVTQFACMVDATTSTIGFPLDPLFWCMGSWGSSYPLAGFSESTDYIEANAAIAAKMIYKLHRQGILWGSIGKQGLCGKYPMPIWRKSQYSLLLLHPIPDIIREPIGRSGMIWDWAKNYPLSGDNFVWMLYRKRDCCAF
jgi:conjugal transfer pilus assembly protein TraU